MVNMLKVLIGVFILMIIISIAFLGKRFYKIFMFRTAETPHIESEAVLWVITLLSVMIPIIDFTTQNKDATILMSTGIYLIIGAIIIQITAKRNLTENYHHLQLRKNFHVAKKGIYSIIRHPSKTALLMTILGINLALGSTWGIIVTIFLLFPALLFRISQEEKALIDEFGDRYYDYQEETKKLIPLVY